MYYVHSIRSQERGGVWQSHYIHTCWQASEENLYQPERVIDKDRHIFKNRARGILIFNPEDGSFNVPDSSVILPAAKYPPVKEKLILGFGDSYFLDQFIQMDGIKPAIDAVGCSNPDTLYTMIHYYVLCRLANCHAKDWWEGNYASILYPNAELESQRISNFLAEIGDEEKLHDFL